MERVNEYWLLTTLCNLTWECVDLLCGWRCKVPLLFVEMENSRLKKKILTSEFFKIYNNWVPYRLWRSSWTVGGWEEAGGEAGMKTTFPAKEKTTYRFSCTKIALAVWYRCYRSTVYRLYPTQCRNWSDLLLPLKILIFWAELTSGPAFLK